MKYTYNIKYTLEINIINYLKCKSFKNDEKHQHLNIKQINDLGDTKCLNIFQTIIHSVWFFEFPLTDGLVLKFVNQNNF